jgi:extradiol dioxygenase family protein
MHPIADWRMAMGLNALHHFTVRTDDLEATRDFYADVLGLEVGFRPRPWENAA